MGEDTCIAIIEDDNHVMTLLTEFLGEMEGYDVRPHAQWNDAFEFIMRTRPQLVILDMRLGGDLHGLSILKRMTLDPLTRTIPVLVCSAVHPLHLPGDALCAERAVRLVSKPFDLSELQDAVESLLASTRVALPPPTPNARVLFTPVHARAYVIPTPARRD
jgi:DNA-binding NtrC family response regulator